MEWWRSLPKWRRSQLKRWAIYAVTAAVVIAVAVSIDWGRVQGAFWQWDIVKEQFPEVITIAAKNTLILTFFGFTGGLVIGLALALLRLSSAKPFRWFASTYIEIVRGIPLLLWIILIGLGIPVALGTGTGLSPASRGAIALAFVAGAYIAETIRAGIEAVPRGQREAARSLGMSSAQAMFWIILPQAFRIIIPPLTNELVLLLKDTSLVSVLGVTFQTRELTRFGRDDVLQTANSTPLIVVGLVYLALTIPLTRVTAYLERRAARSR